MVPDPPRSHSGAQKHECAASQFFITFHNYQNTLQKSIFRHLTPYIKFWMRSEGFIYLLTLFAGPGGGTEDKVPALT